MEEQITLTGAELEEYRALKAAQERRAAKEQRRQMMADYKGLVDDQVNSAIARLQKVSDVLTKTKQEVFEDFGAVLDIKENELKAVRVGQRSHTFTSSDCKKKVKFGYHVTDTWLDTADDGIEVIKQEVVKLGTDEKSKELVSVILELISKDSNGNLDKRKVLQLESLADNLENEELFRGLEMIRKAYRATRSKTFIQAFTRDDVNNEWKPLVLSIVNA